MFSYADEPAPATKPAPVPVQKEEPVAPPQPQHPIQDVSQSNAPPHESNGGGNAVIPGYGEAQSNNHDFQQQNNNGYGNEEQDDQNDGYDQQVGIKEDG